MLRLMQKPKVFLLKKHVYGKTSARSKRARPDLIKSVSPPNAPRIHRYYYKYVLPHVLNSLARPLVAFRAQPKQRNGRPGCGFLPLLAGRPSTARGSAARLCARTHTVVARLNAAWSMDVASAPTNLPAPSAGRNPTQDSPSTSGRTHA